MSKFNDIKAGIESEAKAAGVFDNIHMEYGYVTAGLAKACALLTSAVKAEREEGKAMVRRWKKLGES